MPLAEQTCLSLPASTSGQHFLLYVVVCSVGLLPFLINNVRSTALACKSPALHLVTLTLGGQIKAPDIEAVYLKTGAQETVARTQMGGRGLQAQTFIVQSLAAQQDMLQAEPSGTLVIAFKHLLHAFLHLLSCEALALFGINLHGLLI